MSDYNVIIPHYSVMLAEGLATIIEQQYDFKHKISMELLSAQMNDTYRVHSGQYRYFVRIPRHERFWPFTVENYQFEMHLINFLRQQEIPVAYPIPTKSKSFLGILNAPEGIRYYSMHTEAQGSQPDAKDTTEMRLLGKALAQFHTTTEDYKSRHKALEWDLDLIIGYGMDKLSPHIKGDLRSLFDHINDKTSELIDEFRQYLPDKTNGTWGVIHGNYQPKNTRIADDKVTLFDFEYCGLGYRIFDLVYLLHQTNITKFKNKPFQAFLSSYQEHRSLSEAELNSIQILSKLALVSKMTRSVGMRDLVGVLWFQEQIQHDLAILHKIL